MERNARNVKRVTRLVVLPDYQGIGIGVRLLDFIAKKIKNEGKRIKIITSNPALLKSLDRNSSWVCIRQGRVGKLGKNAILSKGSNSIRRITTSWEYV